MRRMLAGDICKEALGLQGLTVPVAVASNTADASARQVWAQLRNVGRRLCKPTRGHRWQVLTRTWVLDTVPGQSMYDLPPDHVGFTDLTAWNTSQGVPLSGPLTDAQWQCLAARSMGGTVYLAYRTVQDKLQLQATPTSAQSLSIVYTSRNWVQLATPAVPGAPTFADAPTADGDTVLFDPDLMILAVQQAFMQAKGFDTTAVSAQLETMLESAMNADSDAPILYAARSDYTPMVGDAGVIAMGSGSTILVGSRPPTSTDGDEGDFWIDSSANIMYGPKTNGAWAVALQSKAVWA